MTTIESESLNQETIILTKENAIILINFYKIFKDLIIDLKDCFNDKLGDIIQNNNDYQNIINYTLPDYSEKDDVDEYIFSIDLKLIDPNFINSLTNVYNFCKNSIPKRFFDIIYQNEDIFLNRSHENNENNENNEKLNIDTIFLPGIDFKLLYYDDTSDKTKETLWKYLQLILFNIVTSVNDKESFGHNAQLFEAINTDEFKEKLQTTIEGMENLFNFKKTENHGNKDKNVDTDKDTDKDKDKTSDISLNFDNIFESMKEEMNFDSSTNPFNSMPGSEEIFSHINNLINGKIGSLAKELAEETSKDLDIDLDGANDVGDVFKKLFKNPSNLMNLVNSIGKKIDTKMKDGSIKESELLEEATGIFKNMKNMPGMDNMEQLFKSMNMDQFMPKGGKFNNNAFQNMMDQNIKMSKMKERMRKKAEQNNGSFKETDEPGIKTSSESKSNSKETNLNDLTSNLSTLMEQMQNLQKETSTNTSFIDDIIKKQNLNSSNSNSSGQNNNEENKKRRSNNKKKVNKKK